MVVQEPGIDRLDNPRSTLSGNPQLSDALPLDFERSETDGSGEEQRTVKLKV